MSQASVESDGNDLFVKLDGVSIAKRGRPGTQQAGQWVSLEPGYVVLDGLGLKTIIVQFNGIRVQ